MATEGRTQTVASHVALAIVTAYRVLLSPLMGGACRYTPSCSAYADEAIRHHGAGRGIRLALRRLARCHPFGGFGYDPVPAPDEMSEPAAAPARVSGVKG